LSINEDKIRELVALQLKEWTFDDLNRRFGRFKGPDVEELQCNLSKIPDTLFIMMLTAFPNIFYKPKFSNPKEKEKILGFFTSMTESEKSQFVQKVKTKYAREDIKKLKTAMGHTLDLAFPGTSYLVCSQVVILAKLFASIFGSKFDFDSESEDFYSSTNKEIDSNQSVLQILQKIAELVRQSLIDISIPQRQTTLRQLSFEAFMIFPSVVEAFSFDRDVSNLDQRKLQFESTVLGSQNQSAGDFYYQFVTYYKAIKDKKIRNRVIDLCESLNKISLSTSEIRKIVNDLNFKCDLGYSDLKRYF